MLSGKEKVYHDFNKFLFSPTFYGGVWQHAGAYSIFVTILSSKWSWHPRLPALLPGCCLRSRCVCACCLAHKVCVLFTSSNRPHAAEAIVRQWESQAKWGCAFHLCLSGAGGKMIWPQRSLDVCLGPVNTAEFELLIKQIQATCLLCVKVQAVWYTQFLPTNWWSAMLFTSNSHDSGVCSICV